MNHDNASTALERVEILRRISERGKRLAETESPVMIDLFVHLLDEIERLKPELVKADEIKK